METVWRFVQRLAARCPDAILVSGGALGVDTVAAAAGRVAGLTVVEHLPDYARYGRYLAPLERNSRIVNDCDRLVAFWDGESKGTLDSIEKAKARGLLVHVFTCSR